MINKYVTSLIYILFVFTIAINEIYSCEELDCNHYAATKCINPFSNRVEHKKYQEKLLEDDIRPQRKYSIISPSGYFLIHYDTEGEHKVDAKDSNNNGIPDYVDSTAYYFDYVYQIEIEELKYKIPLKDTLGGNDLYDIYLTQLCREKDAIYGFTGLDYETSINDKLIQGVTYIYVDNDFSPTDSVIVGNGKKAPAFFTKGYDALKITAAHEFHHAIQYAYGLPVISSASLNEMYCTYMERIVYPETKDYYQYVNDLMTNPANYPFGSGDGKMGYRWSLFAEYLDIIGGNQLLKSVWEIISNENDGYTALDSALIKHNSSLNHAWMDFLNYVYFTSSRAQGDNYLRNASELRKISFEKTFNLNVGSQLFNSTINPYQVAAFRVYYDDANKNERATIDFLISNFDSIGVRTQEFDLINYEFEISTTPDSEFTKIDGYDVYYRIISQSNTVNGKYFINEGIKNENQVFAFPQPYKQNKDTDLSIVIKSSEIYEKSAKIEILNMELNSVYSAEKDIETTSGFKSVRLKLEDLKQIGSGIYYYQIAINNSNYFGKFVIID